MTSFNIHKVTNVKLSQADYTSGVTFSTIDLIIKCSDGSTHRVTLFSEGPLEIIQNGVRDVD